MFFIISITDELIGIRKSAPRKDLVGSIALTAIRGIHCQT